MNKLDIVLCVVVLALGGLAAVYPLALASGEAQSCPGKVVCPITGEEVCKDKCPLIDPQRADCPGKLECPLTEELVCRDQCPLGESAAAGIPNCCTGSAND